MDESVLDLDILEETTSGNAGLRPRLLASYLTMLERARPKIEAGLQQMDREAIDFAAHSMRSSSKSVGAMPLARLLGRLEDESRTLPEDELRQLGNECLQMMAMVRAAIEALGAPD